MTARKLFRRPWRLETLEDRLTPANFVVSSLLDSNGPGTLRTAVAGSNTSNDALDTIDIQVAGTITLAATLGSLQLNKGTGAVVINGFASAAGNTTVTITGGTDRLFVVSGKTNATLNDLTVTGGTADSANQFGADGGGILNFGLLTLNRCTIDNNLATSSVVSVVGGVVTGGNARGGGIASLGPTASLTVNNSTISNDTAAGAPASGTNAAAPGALGGTGLGGGIFADNGAVALNNSTVTGNFVSGGDATSFTAAGSAVGGTAEGGGVAVLGTTGGPLVVSGTAITNNGALGGAALGTPNGDTGSAAGGGLFVQGTNRAVTISGSLIGGGFGEGGNGNSATGGNLNNLARGGGAFLDTGGGQTTIQGTTFENNRAVGRDQITGGFVAGNGQGGGLFVHSGTVNVGTSLFRSNVAQGGLGSGGSASGGGIFSQDAALTIASSTLASNRAAAGGGSADGGAITALQANGPGFLIVNSTLSGNTVTTNNADAEGGAVHTNLSPVVITLPDRIQNSTVAENSVTAGGGGVAIGGGVFNGAATGVQVNSTLVALNTITSAASDGPDLSGAFVSAGHNLVGIGDGSTGLVNGTNNDQVGSAANPLDPLLGPLQDNGGFVLAFGGVIPTHALQAGSPAINAGAANGLAFDERGAGFPRANGTGTDVGAIEFIAGPTANPDAYTTAAGVPLAATPATGVLPNDFDDLGAGLTAQLVSAPAAGTLNFNPDGSFTFTPPAGASGVFTFTYSAVNSANVASPPAAVTVNVTPVAVADAFTTAADTPLGVSAAGGLLANDLGTGLSAVVVQPPGQGATLNLQPNGSFTFGAAAGFSGPVTFTYRIRDAAGQASPVVTVTIRVTPTAAPDLYNPPDNLPFTVAAPGVLGNDAGSGLRAAVVAQPAGGSVTLNADGSFTYTPNAGFAGTDAFTYRATDSSNQSTAPVTVTVNVPVVNRGGNFLVGPGTFAVGADFGGGPHVKLYNPDGSFRASFYAYAEPFRGGLRVALADVTGDGVRDIITAAGYFGGPHVKVFDGTDGHEVYSFYAYDAGFSGGVFVAGGDLDGDGHAEIVTGAGAGGGPHVKIFSGKDGHELASYYAYDANFSGGVHVAVGDLDGNGHADVITGPGAGGGPHVRVFAGLSTDAIRNWYATDATFTGGVWVAAGDLDGDGKAEVVTGLGAGGQPLVATWGGPGLAKGREFLAYAAEFSGGVRVATDDLDNDGNRDIVTAAGPGGGPHVRALDGQTLHERLSIYAFDPNFLPPFGGVFAGG